MRVVIAEDAALLREGLRRLLEDRGHEVVATVDEPVALVAAVAAHGPDAAIVDVRMPPTFTDEGLRAAIELRRDHPATGVLVFSQYIETRYATRLLAAGAAGVGYLLKDRVADVAEFTDALARVAAGGTALDPEVVSQLLGARLGDRRPILSLTTIDGVFHARRDRGGRRRDQTLAGAAQEASLTGTTRHGASPS